MKQCYFKINITLNNIQYLKNTCCFYTENRRISIYFDVFLPNSRKALTLTKEEFSKYFSLEK